METPVPDVEVFKIVMNGGMFGLWAVFVVWLLWYGAPMVRDTLKYVADKIDDVADKNEKAIDKLIVMIETHREQDRHDNQTDRASCRESRHDHNNTALKLIGEMASEVRQAVRDELRNR